MFIYNDALLNLEGEAMIRLSIYTTLYIPQILLLFLGIKDPAHLN